MQRRTPSSQQNKDTALARAAQQLKKPPDSKKASINVTDSSDDAQTQAAGVTNPSTANATKEEDDIYEFKSTPKDSNSSDDKSDGGKSSSDKSSDEKSGIDDAGSVAPTSNTSAGNQTKRAYSEVEGGEDCPNSSAGTEDDNKRKKRKDSETTKDLNKSASGTRAPARQDKCKVIGPASKAIGLAGKSVQLDRKSPCASPKPVAKNTDSDVETDNDNKSDNFSSGGPKVPPLKIVIPQQTTTGDQDTGSRNGKNTSTRGHAALPYVVASSNSGNESNTDKESSSSRCTSPAESTKATDEKQTKPPTGTGTSASTAEERAQQRVLRSSHRSGGSTGQTVDRGSNNSSPQLQSSSPSPAPSNGPDETPSAATKQSNTTVSTASPANQSQATASTTPPESETAANAPSPSASSTSSTTTREQSVELHPRKRKIRASKEENKSNQNSSNSVSSNSTSALAHHPSETEKETIMRDSEVHPTDQPITNCYQTFLNIRKQIERRQRNLFPVQPKPPQGFKDYLMNRCTYVLSGKTSTEPTINFPQNLPPVMKEIYQMQEKERHKLKMQHVVEKEKLVLAVEQEILRVHGRAARALANQSLPFSVCTILKDEEVYNMITPEQEEKDRNARSRYNGRLFLSWLQDVDDKWEKIKEAMLFRHHNEVESLHAVQKMDWEWKMKELLLCEYKAKPVIEEQHVPIVHVSDDFDLLPA